MNSVVSEGVRQRKLVLLLGSARSGTSWLAKMLDTNPRVHYSHEPLKGDREGRLEGLSGLVGTGMLSAEGQSELRQVLSEATHSLQQPPFFRKSFQRLPTWLMSAAWALCSKTGRGYKLFSRYFSPSPKADYDLLVKSVGWQGRVSHLMHALQPDHFFVIVRHPCGVVSSRLEGMRLGVMDSYRAGWLEHNLERCQALGYSPEAVTAMETYEYFALHWLLCNLEYLDTAARHPSSRVVVYEELCRNPGEIVQGLFDQAGWQMGEETTRFINQSTTGGLAEKVAKLVRGKRAYYRLHRNPAESAEKWRTYLTEAQQRRIMQIVEPYPHLSWWSDRAPASGPERPVSTADGVPPQGGLAADVGTQTGAAQGI